MNRAESKSSVWVLAAAVLALCVVLTPVDSAWAQDESPSFDALVEHATAAYSKKDYDAAIELFNQAYKVEPQSNILYNLGRIYERQGKLDEAITYYDDFLVAPEVDSDLRRDALERRRLLGEVLALRESKKAEDAKETAAKVEAAPAPMPTPKAGPPSESASVAPWIVMGVGGASVLASLGLMAVTAGHDDTFNDSNASLAARQDARDAGQTTAMAADITMGLGLAAVAAGAAWLVLDSTDESNTTATSDNEHGRFSPLLGEQVGVMWQINFE